MRNKLLLLTLAMAVLAPTSLFASGFGYYEHGAKATAMAGAFVGRADDVTAVFYNPAGIAFLEGTHINFGMHPINPDFKATFMGSTTAGTTDMLYPASAFFSTPLTKDITFGFGFFVPFGLSTDWPRNWVGNQLSYHTAVRAYYFQPTIAYKVNDQLSIGAGLDIVRGKLEVSQMNVQSMTISPLLPPLSIAIDTVVEVTDMGYGVNLGLLYKATPKFSIGVSYKSEVSMGFEGDVDFSPTPTGISAVDSVINGIFTDQSVSLDIKMPQIFAVGTMFKATDKINLQFDVQWTGWSSVDKLELNFNNPLLDSATPTDWKNIFTLRFGGDYMLDPFWTLRAGYIYDQGAIPDNTLSPLLPDSNRNELTFGIGYDTLESCCWGRIAVDFALQYIMFADHTSTLPVFPATYESNALIIGMGFTYSF